jgi:hypothetical protein
MTQLLRAALAGLLMFGGFTVVQAQDENRFQGLSQAELAEIAKAQEEMLIDLGAQLDTLKATAKPDGALAGAVRDVEITYYQAHAQQNRTIAALLQKQEDIFLYQDIASYTLLVVVVMVCIAGVVFSAKELNRSIAAAEAAEKRATGLSAKGQAADTPANGTPTPNNIKIGFDGLQITSALTGVTVLTLSLGFLYLFLQEVYQIDAMRVPHIEDGAHPDQGKK